MKQASLFMSTSQYAKISFFVKMTTLTAQLGSSKADAGNASVLFA
jgi:hypothetical protein